MTASYSYKPESAASSAIDSTLSPGSRVMSAWWMGVPFLSRVMFAEVARSLRILIVRENGSLIRTHVGARSPCIRISSLVVGFGNGMLIISTPIERAIAAADKARPSVSRPSLIKTTRRSPVESKLPIATSSAFSMFVPSRRTSNDISPIDWGVRESWTSAAASPPKTTNPIRALGFLVEKAWFMKSKALAAAELSTLDETSKAKMTSVCS